MATKAEVNAMLKELEDGLMSGEIPEDQAESHFAEIQKIPVDDDESTLSKVSTPVFKALDYAGGVARAAVANRPEFMLAESLSNYFNDKPQVDMVSRGNKELLNALKAQPASSSELMESRGVGEMGSVDLPFVGKVTGRGSIGAVADTVLDPLSYVGGGLAKGATKASGKNLFKSGLKQVDKAVLKAGKEVGSYSDTMLKYGISGSAESMMNQADDVAEALLKQKEELLKQADEAGKSVDLLPKFEEYSRGLDKIINGPDEFAAKAAAAVKEQVESQIARLQPKIVANPVSGAVLEKTIVSPSIADGIKTSLYQNVPENVYDVLSRTKQGQDAIKDLARITKESVEASVPGIKEVNKDLGTILTGKKAAFGEFSKEVTKNGVSSVDAALAWLDPATAIAKKAGDISKMPGFRTGLGKSMVGGTAQAISAPAGVSIYEILKEQTRGNNK